MGFTIKLIVHGVPMGHKTWGANDADYKYIKTFYGATSQTPERMAVEIQTINNQTFCYYTFTKGTNVHASDGRPGAYIALTLCANAYYADIQNIYSILRTAYHKICVGTIMQTNEDIHKFVVSDFATAESQLKQVEQLIINYLGTFSNPDDLIPLAQFNATNTTNMAEINLHECSRQVALNQMQATHRLTVSPYFPSQFYAKEILRRDAEITSTRQQMSQQITELKKHQEAAFAKAHDELMQLQQHCTQLERENAILKKNQKTPNKPIGQQDGLATGTATNNNSKGFVAKLTGIFKKNK